MLQVHLLGELRLRADDRPIPVPHGRPARSLLAWLALHPGPRSRPRIAAALWPDVRDDSARASLRTALSVLRGTLGPTGALRAERGELALEAWVDVFALDPADQVGAGDLLAGHNDDWVLEARDEHREHLAQELALLAHLAETPHEAVAHARARAALDPLGEEAARDLARRLDAAGDRGAALVVLDRLRRRLRTELAVAPSPATRELAARLRSPDRDVRTLGRPRPRPSRTAPAACRWTPAGGTDRLPRAALRSTSSSTTVVPR